jgi:hypothetical protein
MGLIIFTLANHQKQPLRPPAFAIDGFGML